MKLASTILAAAALLLAAATPASAADDEKPPPQTYEVRWNVTFDFHEHCCSGSVDHVVRFAAEGALRGLRIDADGHVTPGGGGNQLYDTQLSRFQGWRHQCCDPKTGVMIEDCTLVDGEVGGLQWGNPTRGARQHTLFFIPMKYFIGDYDCGLSMKFLRKTWRDAGGTSSGLMRAPVTPPDPKDDKVTRNIHVTVSDHECPIEDYLATFSCQATMKGKVTFIRQTPPAVDDDDLGLTPLTPLKPLKKAGVKLKSPALSKDGETLTVKGVSASKVGTLRMMVFPEPGAKGSPKPKKPRARVSQGEDEVAQFVEVLMPEGAPRDIEIPLDGQAQRAIEEAGGLRLQLDWLPAGGKPVRTNVVVAV